MPNKLIDLGDNHTLKYYGWYPDRSINPQYADIPDIEKCGASVSHLKPDGTACESFIHFDTPEIRRVFGGDHFWQVQSWEPLTVSPSLLCLAEGCGDHGFIRDGKWVRA